MKLLCLFLVNSLLVYPADGSPVEEFGHAVQNFSKTVEEGNIGSQLLIQERKNLFEAWSGLRDVEKSHGVNRELVFADLMVIHALDAENDFQGVAGFLKLHSEFCETNEIGLIGRNPDSLERFIQAHARSMHALGEDPLEGKKLPYELSATDRGYEALSENTSYNGERVDDYQSYSLKDFPPDETVGEYLQFDKTGRFVRKMPAGLKYPADGSPLRNRLRSLYTVVTMVPDGPPVFTRKEPGEVLRQDPGIAGGSDAERPVKARLDAMGSGKHEEKLPKPDNSTGNGNIILTGSILLVGLLVGLLVFKLRKS